MNYVTEKEQNSRKDEVVDSHGVKVFVDPAALFFIVGTEMNYEVWRRMSIKLTYNITSF